jgi:hypothetical protein
MQRLHWESLSPSWSEFVKALFRDLEPLGHSLKREADGSLTAEIREAGEVSDERHWDRAHSACHQAVLEQHRTEILSFEKDFDQYFVDMTTFQPSAVRPILQVVDFTNPDQMRIVEYLRLAQSVTSRKLVGRRMGLLIWDTGQTGGPRFFGGAILASARFSQHIRDRRLGWPSDYPRTNPRHDPRAREIRLYGLDRIMQLAIACAMPPYNILSGAWLAAIAPFTAAGLNAFRASRKTPDPNADLAAVVTTTGKAISGSPFRGHRVLQIAPRGTLAAPGAKGDLYTQIRRDDDVTPLRASFQRLLGEEVRALARTLYRQEQPAQCSGLKSPDRSAMTFALRRLGLRSSIFFGNEIGVHVGMLGETTLDSLRTGFPRPLHERPVVEWEQVVGVWSRKFLPAPEVVGESADKLSKIAHREARQSRNERARTFPVERIRLSHLLRDEGPPPEPPISQS